MESNESQYDGLLNAIYETIDNPAFWKEFCARLLKSTETASVHLFAFDRHRNVFSYGDGFDVARSEPLELIRPLYRDDPRLEWLRAFAPGKWLHYSDTAESDHASGLPVFEPRIPGAEHRHVSLCKLIDSSSLTVMLACRRDAAQGPLSDAARALLDRLTPHLIRALRLHAQRSALSASALVQRASPPAMLVDAHGEVLHSNERAQQLLNATSLVRVRAHQLRLPAPWQARLLEDVAIAEARLRSETNGAREAAARFRALRIVAPGDTNGPEVLYAFYNVQTYGDAPVAELCAVAALTFYHPRSAPPVDEQILADAFDLSPAECRIAHLLAEGLTQKEIAARVGVQHDTVRKQLQSVFQKTATRRQPDLLRLLLNLPVHRTQQTHRTHAG